MLASKGRDLLWKKKLEKIFSKHLSDVNVMNLVCFYNMVNISDSKINLHFVTLHPYLKFSLTFFTFHILIFFAYYKKNRFESKFKKKKGPFS